MLQDIKNNQLSKVLKDNIFKYKKGLTVQNQLTIKKKIEKSTNLLKTNFQVGVMRSRLQL